MLVLVLASMIASIPGAGSAVVLAGQQSLGQRCLPLPNGWRRQGCEFGELASVNLLEMRNDRLIWNGRAVSSKKLQVYLRQTQRLSPRPGIVFVVDAASSKSSAATIRRAIETHTGCGLENVCVEYTVSEWKRAQPPAGPKLAH